MTLWSPLENYASQLFTTNAPKVCKSSKNKPGGPQKGPTWYPKATPGRINQLCENMCFAIVKHYFSRSQTLAATREKHLEHRKSHFFNCLSHWRAAGAKKESQASQNRAPGTGDELLISTLGAPLPSGRLQNAKMDLQKASEVRKWYTKVLRLHPSRVKCQQKLRNCNNIYSQISHTRSYYNCWFLRARLITFSETTKAFCD